MTTETLAPDTDARAALNSSAITPILSEISRDGGPRTDGDFSAVAMLLVDSLLTGDEESLRVLQDWLRQERAQGAGDRAESRGRLLGLIDASHWAIERVLPRSEVARVERSSHANQFLNELAASPGLGNRELADRLSVDETQVSRLGRTLREHGLAASRQIGRRNRWELTPKGMRTLEVLNGVARDAASSSSTVVDDGSAAELAEDDLPEALDVNSPASILAALAKLFAAKPAVGEGYVQTLEKELPSPWLASMEDETVWHIASLSVGLPDDVEELSHDAKEVVVAKLDELLTEESSRV
jgi:DNA-binding MarR family transcriptional regulator